MYMVMGSQNHFFSDAGEMIPSRAPRQGGGRCKGQLSWNQEAETEGFLGFAGQQSNRPRNSRFTVRVFLKQ